MVLECCTKYEQDHHILPGDITTLSLIIFCVHQQPMVPDHGTKYEENPANYHGGMCEDGHKDRRTGLISIFHNSDIEERVNNKLRYIACKLLFSKS